MVDVGGLKGLLGGKRSVRNLTQSIVSRGSKGHTLSKKRQVPRVSAHPSCTGNEKEALGGWRDCQEKGKSVVSRGSNMFRGWAKNERGRTKEKGNLGKKTKKRLKKTWVKEPNLDKQRNPRHRYAGGP